MLEACLTEMIISTLNAVASSPTISHIGVSQVCINLEPKRFALLSLELQVNCCSVSATMNYD